MKIADLTIETPVFLAPMAGYTNLPFRLLAKKFGAGAVTTEMVSVKGLYYGDHKTPELMKTLPEEAPAGLQIFGSDPEIIGEVVAARTNATDFAWLDFNAGCPAPKIVKNGDGSALLKKPELLATIVEKIKAVSTKPLIVKMRSGWDEENINGREVARLVEAAGADAITVHGRTRKAFYSGTADWNIIGEIKAKAKIPVILNGDVQDGDAAARALAATGCDGVMVGRAAVGNPFVFREIKARLTDGTILPLPTPEEKLRTAIEHLELTSLMEREESVIKEMRKHLAAYTKGLKKSTELRCEIFKLTTRQETIDLLSRYLEAFYGVSL